MFAKIEKDTEGKISHAYYIFDKDAEPNLFPGVLVNDGVVENVIRDNSALVMDTYYYDNDATVHGVYPRPGNPATIDKTTITADGVDSATISGIPAGTIATTGGQSYTVTDGVFEVASTSPGIIQIKLELFPYLDKTFEVTAG